MTMQVTNAAQRQPNFRVEVDTNDAANGQVRATVTAYGLEAAVSGIIQAVNECHLKVIQGCDYYPGRSHFSVDGFTYGGRDVYIEVYLMEDDGKTPRPLAPDDVARIIHECEPLWRLEYHRNVANELAANYAVIRLESLV